MFGLTKALHRLVVVLIENNKYETERHEELMTALETLQASITSETTAITALTASVDDAVSHIGSPSATDAQLLSLATAVDQLTVTVAAQTKRLQDAVNPPPPAPGS